MRRIYRPTARPVSPTRRQVLAGAGTGAGALAFAALPVGASVPSDPDIVVIGAGAAGLAATRSLMEMGVSVACIEAQSRIGGRAYTEHKTFGVPYDRGCHWLTASHMNPWIEFGRTNGYAVYPEHSKDEERAFINGREITDQEWGELDAAWYAMYDQIGDAGRGRQDVSPKDVVTVTGPWAALCEGWIGPWEMGKDFDQFSCQDWWNSEGGESHFCTQGFGTLVQHYGSDIPVQLNTPASVVRWGGDGVEVETPAGTIHAGVAIITVSTGVLAAEGIRFDPALPANKQESFHRISMGIYNNIALQFSEDIFSFGPDVYVDRQVESVESTGWLSNISGSNLTFGYSGGRFGRELERAGVEATVDFGLSELRKILGSSIDKKFIKGEFTRWGEDPWFQGAYASADPGYYPMRRELNTPEADKIYFAGEACSGMLWATAAGALENGILVAQRAGWSFKN